MVSRIERLLIVGGGTAGWMAAAVLAKALGPGVKITLVESEAIGTVGVGEATIPQIHHVNAYLGLDENDFVRATQATFKLGIRFHGWGAAEESYIHAFGDIGMALGAAPFHQYWLRARRQGEKRSLWDFSLNARAAAENRFAREAEAGPGRKAGVKYAFHFDASLYAAYLRRFAEARGVERIEGRIESVALDGESGFVEAVLLEGGRRVEADFFLDCSGFRALVIGETLNAPFEDWSRFLPSDRAAAVPCRRAAPLRPYTEATARAAGWQWRIPLQHRVGNGHVYCSHFMSDDEAAATLLANLEGEALGEPRLLRFTTGIRSEPWRRNCLALGLASGFMEPLESTSIHLIQSAINRFVALYPAAKRDDALAAEYNRQTRFEAERIRDFLVLHYFANRRDEPFWRACREMAIPESLSRKIDAFADSGRLLREADELFTEVGWLQVLMGQGVSPRAFHPAADILRGDQLTEFLDNIDRLLARAVGAMPAHEDFIKAHCAA